VRDRLDLLTFHAYLQCQDHFREHLMRPYPPLSPAVLAAYVRQQGWRADFFDPTLQPDETSFAVALSRHRPRVVGLFGHPTTRSTAWRLVATARIQGCLVIAYGDDPSAVPDVYLDHGVDAVLCGEAELPMAAVLQRLDDADFAFDPAMLSDVPGLAVRVGDETVMGPEPSELLDLDLCPPPIRDPVLTRAYLQRWEAAHGFAALTLVTSRGIPGTPGFRRRAPSVVAKEIGQLREQFDFDRIRFVDHVFTHDPGWHLRLAAAMDHSKAPPEYECLGRVRDINRALLEFMAEAGCTRITFDVGTGSRRLLRQLDRGYGIEDVYRAARLMREMGIQMGVLVSLGLEGETREDVLATIEMLKVVEPAVWGLTLEDPEIAASAHDLNAMGLPGMRTLRSGWPDPERQDRRRLPLGFYRWALRLIAAEMHLHRQWQRRKVDPAALGMAAVRPLYRSMVRVYPLRAR
jgi:anaerobic magnesium-protoporphyrin IX monomethyl ester cyclase